jgi:hypothetical protein
MKNVEPWTPRRELASRIPARCRLCRRTALSICLLLRVLAAVMWGNLSYCNAVLDMVISLEEGS